MCVALGWAVAPEASAQEATIAVLRPPRPATPQLIARAVERGEISAGRGALYLANAFTSPGRLPPAFRSRTPWDGTVPLLELRRSLPALLGGPAAKARALLRRAVHIPCGGSDAKLPDRMSSRHFYLQFNEARLGGGLGIGNYANALETSWETEVPRFGWARPPKDPSGAAPGGRYVVRIADLGGGLYGYVARTRVVGNNPATPWRDRDAAASCMVLNQNYGPFPSAPIASLRATAAHEFNHSIQFGYGALTGYGDVGSVFVEGGATWMEDEVFDAADDNYLFLWPQFSRAMGRYSQNPNPASPYQYWIVFRAMTERFGTGTAAGGQKIMRFFWEQISKGASTNLEALNRAAKKQGSSLPKAFHDAAVALRFTVPCGAATDPPYCLNESAGYVAARGPNRDTAVIGNIGPHLDRSIQNNYAMNWIGLPIDAGPMRVVLDVTSAKGKLRASIVCRNGRALTFEGTPKTVREAGGGETFASVNPAGCDELVAVIANVRQTAATPLSITSTRYRLDTDPP